MNCYLLIDFGSTYTKLSLVDMDHQKLIKRVSAHTTVSTTIKVGYEEALEKLKSEVDFKDVNIIEVLGCSSAGGGLKIVAIGITPHFTVEAAKRAALGAGGRILKTYSYFLKEEQVEEIDQLKPDIILLSGGAEGGNTSYILHNARMLRHLKKKIPIVVSGNSDANEEIENIFNGTDLEYQITENVMPDINRINPTPVREVIRKIFMRQIVKAKGMEEVEEITDDILMPTPTAVLKAAELLSQGTDKYQGLGDIMVIDIGGATTDVHTVSEPVKDHHLFIEGLEEPFLKRTVEGDLGMRYSALSLFENVGEENFFKYDTSLKDIKGSCLYRHNNPEIVFEDPSEVDFDEIMAKNCVEFSVKRHGGKLRSSYINGRTVMVQSGKDLRDIKMVIGTGGIIVNSSQAKAILVPCLQDDPNKLLPINPTFAIDKKYILSAIGLLSMRDKDAAFKILTENLLNI